MRLIEGGGLLAGAGMSSVVLPSGASDEGVVVQEIH